MRRTIAMMTAGGLLALAPAGAWAQAPASTTQHLDHLMIENADTPAEHEALARYYRTKAAEAKSLAEEHRAMGKSYTRSKPGVARSSYKGAISEAVMAKHCDRIAELNAELAARYEDLAKGEDAAAKP
jgi:hypothetical protein